MTNFQTAQIFGDNMVLQFQKPVSVFGTGTDGTKITVSISGMEAATNSTVVHNGRWLVMLPPQPAQDSVELTVSDGSESRTFTNVAVGAVWLAGGQSNMELELRNCSTGKDSLENDDTPNVRFYYAMKKTIADDSFFESEKQMVWNDFSNKESAQYWSAVGYYFAKELSERLGITVGIIGCNWGGTSASCWTSREFMEQETLLKPYLDKVGTKVDEVSDQKTSALSLINSIINGFMWRRAAWALGGVMICFVVAALPALTGNGRNRQGQRGASASTRHRTTQHTSRSHRPRRR